MQAIVRVSSNHADKLIAVVTIDKSYSRQQIGIRARSEYYAGELSKVTTYLYREGRQLDSLDLWSK